MSKQNCYRQGGQEIGKENRLIKSFGLMNNGDEAMNHILSGLKQKIISLEHAKKT